MSLSDVRAPATPETVEITIPEREMAKLMQAPVRTDQAKELFDIFMLLKGSPQPEEAAPACRRMMEIYRKPHKPLRATDTEIETFNRWALNKSRWTLVTTFQNQAEALERAG